MREDDYNMAVDLQRMRLAERLIGDCINFPEPFREKKRQLMLVVRDLKNYCEHEVERRLRRVSP